jgi:hypothetical protein
MGDGVGHLDLALDVQHRTVLEIGHHLVADQTHRGSFLESSLAEYGNAPCPATLVVVSLPALCMLKDGCV